MPDLDALMAVSRGSEPTGAAFDIVLLLHIGCVVIALIAVVISAAQAGRLQALGLVNPARDPDRWAKDPPPAELVRYYRPGPNWAGRVVWGVPVFGFVLLALSHGYYRFGQRWILIGLAIFVVVALVGEGLLWPAERQLQQLVTGAAFPPRSDRDESVFGEQPASTPVSMVGPSRRVVVAAVAMAVLMVAASVIMVAQPT